MPINWLLETAKFYILIQSQHKVRFQKCIKAVFSGVSIAIFTPNRVGEYAGRIVLFSKSSRRLVVWATIIGNYAQIIAILSVGIVGFYGLALKEGIIHPISSKYYVILNCSLLLILGIVFFQPYRLFRFFFQLIPVEKWRVYLIDTLKAIRQFSVYQLSIVLILSLLRYFTFGYQFFLTLCFFNVKLNSVETFQSISTVYLLKTTIPYPPAMGFLMRGEISIWVYQFFTENLVAVIASSMLIWIINVASPALIGYLLLLRENWLKN